MGEPSLYICTNCFAYLTKLSQFTKKKPNSHTLIFFYFSILNVCGQIAEITLINNSLSKLLSDPKIHSYIHKHTTELLSCEMLFGSAWHCKNCRFTLFILFSGGKPFVWGWFIFSRARFSRDLLGTRFLSHSLFLLFSLFSSSRFDHFNDLLNV